MATSLHALGLRPVIALALAVSLSGCMLWEAVAPSACPDITRASAWVDRMPKIDDSGDHDLKVSLRLKDTASWMLVKREGSSPDHLILELVPGGSFHPGNTAYSGDEPVVRDTRVSIVCDGRVVHEIDQVMVTY